MKAFSIATLGCKVNQYESQQIITLLERLGLTQAERNQVPDLVVVNTCCVTHVASAKSRRQIHRAQRLNPHAVVLVCGCLPTVQTGELNLVGDNTYVITNRHDLVPTLSRLANNKTAAPDQSSCQNSVIKAENNPNINYENKLESPAELPPIDSFHNQTRAFLKIQDGCDAYCTYCIVPKTRPDVHSKPQAIALEEAKSMVKSGHKEIVLTGVFLGAYGQTTVRRKIWPNQENAKLAELLDQIAQISGLSRIRLSSLEPGDVTPRLLDVFCNHPNIMPHLHLSLQSGSYNVLKKMARQYSTDDFRKTVALSKSRIDRPAITTDIIVGFPSETDADFEQTVNLAGEIGFAKMHVFAFSPRMGTTAANMKPQIGKATIKKRSNILRKLDAELQSQFRQQFIGETADVLVENATGRVCGRSERYFMVCLKGEHNNLKRNNLVTVKLVDNAPDSLIGELI